MLATRLYRFLYDQADANLIDGYGVQHDRDLEQRNLERVRKVIEQMGEKWILYRKTEQ